MKRVARVKVDLSTLHTLLSLPADAMILHVAEDMRRCDGEDAIQIWVEHPALPECEPYRWPPEATYVIKQEGSSPKREFVEWVIFGEGRGEDEQVRAM